MLSVHVVCASLGALGFLAGCAETRSGEGRAATPAKEVAISEIAGTFSSYRRMTPEGMGVFVNPDLAQLCIGAHVQQVTEARKEFGPHAHTAVHIYMNEAAAHAFTSKAAYPVGAIIVKQKLLLNYRLDGYKWAYGRDERKGVGGMVKRAAGYDREHGDWEYFYFDDPRNIESGRIASCVQCHAAAKATGHVFGGWAGPKSKIR